MEERLLLDNIRYNEIKNTIKIWPYLDDISQAIFPYTNRYLSKDTKLAVNIDFTNVKKVNSSGAAITLKKLVSLKKHNEKNSRYVLVLPKDKNIEKYMHNIGFFSMLDDYYHFDRNGNLFDRQPIDIQRESEIVIEERFNIKKTSHPLFRLKYNKNNVRESVEGFEDWLNDYLLDGLQLKHRIKTDVLFSVLTEIAKNSQDHTKSDAFWGFDVIEDTTSGCGELVFSCSDLGKGIAQSVRDHLETHPQEDLRLDIWKHGSLTDLYKWAFTLGNTTSTKLHNKGIGMTMIIDGAQELNMDLSFFDARSMMQIPNSLHYSENSFSHEELRRKAWNTENKVGFYYYGRLKF